MSATGCAPRRFSSRLLLAVASWPLLLALGACGTQPEPEPQMEPVSQTPTIYTQVAAGGEHTCALVNDGTVQCWGMNASGQLGNTQGNTQASYLEKEKTDQWGFGNTTPVTIKDLTGAIAISAGNSHTCALLRSGTVKCWGYNGNGQLGNGSTTPAYSSTPVTVTSLTGVVTAISAKYGYTCALLRDGTVKCWGRNLFGRLGNGTTKSDSSIPVTVLGLKGVTAISAGSSNTCAVLSDGSVKCWGSNLFGELGTGRSDFDFHPTPVAVQGLTNVTAISVGGSHTCALLDNGAVKCWGRNIFGSLGNGDETTEQYMSGSTPISVTSRASSSVPLPVQGLTGATAISTGDEHTCALLGDGTIRCWGYNGNAQIGQVGISDSSTPMAVTSLTGVTAISAGGNHTCALRRDGSIWCWGRNYEGQLGDGTRDKPGAKSRSTPARVRN